MIKKWFMRMLANRLTETCFSEKKSISLIGWKYYEKWFNTIEYDERNLQTIWKFWDSRAF